MSKEKIVVELTDWQFWGIYLLLAGISINLLVLVWK